MARRHETLSLLAGAALAIAAAQPAFAQSGWQQDWNRLVEAANREGKISVGGPIVPSARVFLNQHWPKAFPKIQMNYMVAGGFDWGNRVKAERASGKYEWDIYMNGPNAVIYGLSASGVFEELAPNFVRPDLKDPKTWRRPWNDMFLDNAKKMMAMFASPSTIWYNAQTVDPAKVDRLGIQVLFDPAYKGRIAWNDPRTAGPGSNYAAMFYELVGKDGLRKLIVDQETVFYSRAIQATEALFRGKADFVIAMQLDQIAQYEKAGAKFDVRPLGTDAKTAYLGFGGAVLAIFNKAPHPNAAKLFANWILSKEVQDELSKMVRWDSTRADVAPVSPGGMRYIPGEKYVESQRESMLARRAEAMAFIRELRPN
jgi:iron(III) transport system substrate-binding protein